VAVDAFRSSLDFPFEEKRRFHEHLSDDLKSNGIVVSDGFTANNISLGYHYVLGSTLVSRDTHTGTMKWRVRPNRLYRGCYLVIGVFDCSHIDTLDDYSHSSVGSFVVQSYSSGGSSWLNGKQQTHTRIGRFAKDKQVISIELNCEQGTVKFTNETTNWTYTIDTLPKNASWRLNCCISSASSITLLQDRI